MFKNYTQLLFVLILLFFGKIVPALSETVKQIKVIGNDRISKETIILFSSIELNQVINNNDINNIVKDLYETRYFKDISTSFENQILTIENDQTRIKTTFFINSF